MGSLQIVSVERDGRWQRALLSLDNWTFIPTGVVFKDSTRGLLDAPPCWSFAACQTDLPRERLHTNSRCDSQRVRQLRSVGGKYYVRKGHERLR